MKPFRLSSSIWSSNTIALFDKVTRPAELHRTLSTVANSTRSPVSATCYFFGPIALAIPLGPRTGYNTFPLRAWLLVRPSNSDNLASSKLDQRQLNNF